MLQNIFLCISVVFCCSRDYTNTSDLHVGLSDSYGMKNLYFLSGNISF